MLKIGDKVRHYNQTFLTGYIESIVRMDEFLCRDNRYMVKWNNGPRGTHTGPFPEDCLIPASEANDILKELINK